MSQRCEICNNFNPRDHINGVMKASGPALILYYIKLANVLEKHQSGCRYCHLLAHVVFQFVPDWHSKIDKLSLELEHIDRRPVEVCIKASRGPTDELEELADIYISAPGGK